MFQTSYLLQKKKRQKYPLQSGVAFPKQELGESVSPSFYFDLPRQAWFIRDASVPLGDCRSYA